jgi:uncharacterized membrane protein (UPF0136 family)
VLVIAAPIAIGILCGILLGTSKAAYLILSVLTIAGGFLAGFEHAGAREGAIRGLVGGTLFGSFILIAHEIDGREATAGLPHPAIVLVVITAVFGVLLGAWGGRMRQRTEASAPAA